MKSPYEIVKALQTLFGRTEIQMDTLRGVQQNTMDKLNKLDTIENNLSSLFIGYSDLKYDRNSKYRDYDRMDVQSTEASTGLDIYAEEASKLDEKTGLAVYVESEDPRIASELNAMFNRIKLEGKIYGIYRNVAKYGDCFMYLILGAFGIHGMQFIHPSRVERVQEDGLLGYKAPELASWVPMDTKNGIIKPWSFIHFRITSFDYEGFYGKCYDSNTEVLTKQGWKFFKDVTYNDFIATRNLDTKEFEWQQPTDITNEDYSGPMVSFKSSTLDLLVTPNHRMLLTSLPSELNNNKKRKGNKEVIVEAKDLVGKNFYTKIPMTSVWKGEEIKEKVFKDDKIEYIYCNRAIANNTVCRGGANFANWTGSYVAPKTKPRPLTVSGDNFCKLMGAYLSEGNIRVQGGIEINQKEKSKGFVPYKELLEDITKKPAQHNGKAFVLPRRIITEYFRQFGLAPDKFIPEEIMNATPKQQKMFLDYYVLGDGSINTTKCSSKRNAGKHDRITITTVSKKMADQLMELIQKIGYSSSLKVTKPSTHTITHKGKTRQIKGKYPVYQINIRYASAITFNTGVEYYDGTIHCVTVPNSVIYVRRNGLPAWSGNSMLEGIRKTWKNLSMLETMLVLYRLTKSVQRNIFYVDVGQAAVEETQSLVEQYQRFLKQKNHFIDPKTNEFKVDFNPATLLQDIVWPVRAGSQSKVDKLENSANIGPLQDLEHFRNKVRIGLNIPKEYFDGEQSPGWNSKESLLLQDSRFGRKIIKLQKSVQEGLVQMCQIHWAVVHGEYLPVDAFLVKIGTTAEMAERTREDILLRKAQILEILAGIAITLGWNRREWTDYLLDQVYPLPAEFRAKLNTPDPIDLERLENEIRLNQEAGSQISRHVKEQKPPKHATAENVSKGLRSFKEDVSVTPDDLLEEYREGFEEIKEKMSYLVEIKNTNTHKGIYGFTKDEVQRLIDSRQTIAGQLTSLDLNETTWKKSVDWQKLYEEAGTPKER